MPLQFSGITKEHMAVRNEAGIFDVSHMGDLLVSGPGSDRFLDYLCTRNISNAKLFSARYTHMLDEQGRIIDDMLVTPLQDDIYLVVPNAATTGTIMEWMKKHKADFPDVVITNLSHELSCIALQGPLSEEILQEFVETDLSKIKKWKAAYTPVLWKKVVQETAKQSLGMDMWQDEKPLVLVSRTGYTGEDGFELIMPNFMAPSGWKVLAEDSRVAMVGLGARDTLRLEKGYLLSGTDFNRDRTTLETGYKWVVDFKKDFIGKERLIKQKEEGYELLTGLQVEGKGIPRHGYEVVKVCETVAEITSGGMSPVLKRGIAMAYLNKDQRKPGERFKIIKGKRSMNGQVVKLPFV